MSSNQASSIVYRSKLFKNSESTNKPQAANKPQVQANKPQQQAYKTFCKVCQDSGKSEKEFTSHNVRDRTGKTVCPVLLAQECRSCFKHGHTIKYCPLLKEKAQPARPVEPVKPKAAAMPKNVFMLLESDSEEEKEQEPVQQENTEFPTLISGPVTVQKPVLNYWRIVSQVNDPATYAKAKEEEMREKAKKYAEEKEAKRQQDLIKWAQVQAAVDIDREARDERIRKIGITKTKWIDAESSDEEEDDEEQVEDNSAW